MPGISAKDKSHTGKPTATVMTGDRYAAASRIGACIGRFAVVVRSCCTQAPAEGPFRRWACSRGAYGPAVSRFGSAGAAGGCLGVLRASRPH
jgi:hypothetical protein